MASADPMMVCGLVNLQRTMGKGTFSFALSGVDASAAIPDDFNKVSDCLMERLL